MMQSIIVNTDIGDLQVTLLDHQHILAHSDNLMFDDMKMRCSIQGYCLGAVWRVNDETASVTHSATGAQLHGIVVERVSELVLDRVVDYLKRHSELLEAAWYQAQEKQEKHILGQIAQTEAKLAALREELALLRTSKYGT